MLSQLLLLAQNAAGGTDADRVVAGVEAAATEPATDTLTHIYEFLSTQGISFGLNLLAAMAIFVLGRWAAMGLQGVLRRAFDRAKMDAMLASFLCNIAYILLLTIVILAALDRIGVNTTSFAAVLAAAGLAVGLALQGSLSNLASGVMIIFFKPFSIGNFIEAGSVKGVVKEIQIFHTVLDTFDNIRIVIPNSQITGGTIINYSANPTRRIDLVIGCGYDDNLLEVKNFLRELVDSDARILKDPAPTIAVDQLADSSVNLVVRPWVNSADYGPTRWDLIEKIKLGFDERGFSIPYPQTDVHIHQASA